MISVLAQERLLGAALGSASVGIVVLEQRKRIYNSISDERSKIAAKSKVSGKQSGSGSEFALLWNKAVDQIFVPVIESLSSRRWSNFDDLPVPGERKAIWLRVSSPIWNKVVDQIFGPVIESLSSRRWLMDVLYEYDIEDVLDEWEYQKTLLEKSTKWKKFLHSSLQMFEVKYYQPLAHEIKEIKEISNYLQFIAKAKEICDMEAVKSHSLGDSASEIYGRDDVPFFAFQLHLIFPHML